ncbi:MAG TPA: FkbM family methyltransferase [Solirubrobacteraceae bacterium]|nr:FkbM family methyltransferase [Solirubrobacteraceae bacterium]
MNRTHADSRPHAVVRRLRRTVAGHRLSRHVRRTAAAARLLAPASRFLAGELRGGTRRYRLASGIEVVIRHRSRDVDLAVEILGDRRPYEPPPALVPRLNGPLRILDLGGNIGLFGAFALGRFEVETLTSYEPDPANAEILARTIAINDRGDVWRVHPQAVSNADGALRFLAARGPESRLAEPRDDAITVSAVDLFALDDRVDLLKVDIEGGEWALLCDPRLPSLDAAVIVIEWHWRFAPGPDPHGAVRRSLCAAGYEIVTDEPDPAVGIGLIWAARP